MGKVAEADSLFVPQPPDEAARFDTKGTFVGTGSMFSARKLTFEKISPSNENMDSNLRKLVNCNPPLMTCGV